MPMNDIVRLQQIERRAAMKRVMRIPIATAVIGVLLALMPAHAASPQQEKGKTCRMEQQCHWENYKKICVYVKVCR
jgi:hypothetical protein